MSTRGSVITRFGIAFALLLTMVGAFAATGAIAQDAPDATATRIRFLHADTDQDKVEVHINGDEKLDEFQYGDLSDWIDVDPGGVRVTITQDRAGFNYTIFDTVYPLLAGNDYQIVISDMLVISNVVDRSPVADGGARVRLVQGSVDLPEVNVVASGDSGELGTQLIYGRTTDYTVVPAGSVDIEVRLASTGEVVLTMPGIVLEANMSYDLVLMGALDSDDHPLTILPLSDQTLERGAEATPAA